MTAKKPLKVLMITGSYPPMMCGVGDYTGALVDSLRAKQVDVRVVTTIGNQNPSEKKDWVKRIIPTWTWESYSTLLNEARSFSPDIVHIQDPTQGYAFASAPMLMILLSSILYRMNIVWTWHEHPPTRINKRFIMFSLMALLSKTIIVVRPHYKSHVGLFLSLFLSKKPFSFIPNASVIPKITMDNEEIQKARNLISNTNKKIIVYFGFIYPNKGVEKLFDVLNPQEHHLVLVGNMNANSYYHQKIIELSNSPSWSGNVTCTGFISAEEVGRYIKISDAVILPYVEGGGTWNTSLHAAILQGTFVITTSSTEQGYDAERNMFYTKPDDIPLMRQALKEYCGRKLDVRLIDDPWKKIADDHINIYSQIRSIE